MKQDQAGVTTARQTLPGAPRGSVIGLIGALFDGLIGGAVFH